MNADIDASKKTIEEFLKTAKKTPFLIPDYQRPYFWDTEKIEILFNDIKEFSANKQDKDKYFLGCIVTYENENKQEIIDGQQRLTSLYLLLRAIYTKLEADKKHPNAEKYISRIQEILWNPTSRHESTPNKNEILLESDVINENEKVNFQNIIKTGQADQKSKDNYSKNYIKCQALINDFSSDKIFTFLDFIADLLDDTIIIPIKANSQETALDIFSTLNDRGLQLSDSDIFKAKIYKNAINKEEFINNWKELEKNAKYVKEEIKSLFYYQMFYLRALNNDIDTTTPGLRKYFYKDNYKHLYSKNLFEDLNVNIDLWKVVNKHNELENQNWTKNIDILKVLDILSSYPNDFWKYPVLTYYLHNKDKKDFESYFLKFLRKLCVELLIKYLVEPNINAIKPSILKLNSQIIISENLLPLFEFPKHDELYKNRISNPPLKATRMLLKILAYNNNKQDKLLDDSWEIEHILPKKWDDMLFENENPENINEKIENLGNKTPFEKRLNIQATNGFFTKKKENYQNSKYEITKELCKYDNWNIDKIQERNINIKNEIINIFDNWSKEYNINNKYVATPEELEQIKKLRAKGLIK